MEKDVVEAHWTMRLVRWKDQQVDRQGRAAERSCVLRTERAPV